MIDDDNKIDQLLKSSLKRNDILIPNNKKIIQTVNNCNQGVYRNAVSSSNIV